MADRDIEQAADQVVTLQPKSTTHGQTKQEDDDADRT